MWRAQVISPSDETVAPKPVQPQVNNHQFDLPVFLVILRASGWFYVSSFKAHLWDGKYCHHAMNSENYPSRKEQHKLSCPLNIIKIWILVQCATTVVIIVTLES